MKVQLGAALIAVSLLAGCGPNQPAQQAGAADGSQVAAADQPKKKHCSDQTGSRLAPCGQGADATATIGGDAYKDNSIRGGSFVAKPN